MADLIRVGVTEKHGMAVEFSQHPPPGIEYSFLKPVPSEFRILRSPIKGFLGQFETEQHDLIESLLSPIFTKSPWIYSCENFQAATAFNCLGAPVPRSIRVAYIKRLLSKDNCKRIVFWSQAGQRTLATYAGIQEERLCEKVSVVYPAIRRIPDELIRFSDGDIELLFSGDFFRKGGVNVLDAFERIQKIYGSVKLNLCCDERIDFNIGNTMLRSQYLAKIRRNPGVIWLGRVSRDRLIQDLLPRTSIYLLPTYFEAFGFAILEAMAFGIPVIATKHFAIPEMLEHNVSGLLIDTDRFDCERLFRGYVVNDIPEDFRELVTEQVFEFLCQLIESAEMRKRLGTAGMNAARTKFSFERRNEQMLQIYREALR